MICDTHHRNNIVAMSNNIDSAKEAAMTFSKLKKNKATAFALSFAGMIAFSSIASAEENISLPNNGIQTELPPANEFLKLAQAQETAAQKAARKKEERRLERERKKAEREKKRKERRKNRPKFGSFS